MIKTYPEMTKVIMEMLKDSEEFKDQYVYQMLVEQQQEIERLRTIEKAYEAMKKAL